MLESCARKVTGRMKKGNPISAEKKSITLGVARVGTMDVKSNFWCLPFDPRLLEMHVNYDIETYP